MSRLQSVNDLSQDGLKKLLDSIDYVFVDIDGVLLYNTTPIPGSKEGVAQLRKLGKNIAFVSNNSFYTRNVLLQNLKHFGAREDEIVTPNDAMLGYLKKIGFEKDIYIISCSPAKKLLKDAGFNVIEYKDICSDEIEEHLDEVKKLSLKTLEICKNVGAVYLDFDFNFSMGAIQVAKTILNHKKDVIFLSGMQDDTGNLDESLRFVASKYYIDAVERWTKQKSVSMAKPGLALKDALNLKFDISDDNGVLFIGDNVHTDITFGVNSGFKTCLVLSGVTSEDQVKEWRFPEDIKPTYVVKSLGELYEKIKDL